MSLIRSKDTRPEIAVRRLIFSLGFRYRLHAKDLPGKPDIAFRSAWKVIFIHGCFWHLHAASGCKLARLPKSNVDFWSAKLNDNRKRDQSNARKLRRDGWKVLQIWECELAKPEQLKRRIVSFLQ